MHKGVANNNYSTPLEVIGQEEGIEVPEDATYVLPAGPTSTSLI